MSKHILRKQAPSWIHGVKLLDYQLTQLICKHMENVYIVLARIIMLWSRNTELKPQVTITAVSLSMQEHNTITDNIW